MSVRGQVKDCLEYYTVDKDGVLVENRLITLDKTFLLNRNSWINEKGWFSLLYEESHDKYYINHVSVGSHIQTIYLYKKLIDMVDSVVTERYLLEAHDG